MPYSKLGDCYLKAHEFEKAEPVFRKAVVLDPKFTDAEMGLAKTLMRLGDIEEATTVPRRSQPGCRIWRRHTFCYRLRMTGATACQRRSANVKKY